MNQPLRIGVLGLTHDHVWGLLDELRDLDAGTLVAVADPHGSLREKAHSRYGCQTHADYEALLDAESLDAALVFADNAAGAELAERAAQRGLSILVEKPMAATLAGADRMMAAARRQGVRLMVNWPFAWWPPLAHALALAAGGEIGPLWQVKYRAAHCGPRELGCSEFFCDWLYDAERNGAGALMDYCCYGAALACRLLGTPSRVTGVAGRLCKEDITVDDSAVIVMSYPRAVAISEGSWNQIGNLTAYVTAIYGTRGTLLVEPGHDGRLLLATPEHPDGTPVDVPPLPPHLTAAAAHFLHALATGEDFTPLCRDRIARDAQEILQAGLVSARCGREISLPLAAV